MAEDKKKLNYMPPLLFSKEEVAQLRALYSGQDNKNMELLRRVFLPTLIDPGVPVEYGANDMWMDRDFAGIPPEEVKILVLTRQELIKWVTGSLIRLRQMANQPEEESAADKESRMKADSSR